MIIADKSEIKELISKKHNGWYTANPDTKLIIYSDNEDELVAYIENIIGDWSRETVDTWHDWEIIEVNDQGGSAYRY